MYSIKKFPNFQISKFPNFQISLALLFICFQTFGQDNFPKLRNKLDRVFARIDKNQIPFGTLEENSFGFMNLSQVNTITK